MNGEGWIKLYRKIEDSDIWELPPLTRNVWLWILLHTNHEDRTWMGVVVPRGELITSYRSIAEGVAWGTGKNRVVPTIKTVRCIIHKLIQIGNLGQGLGQAPGQGGLWLKVLHWEDYQDKPKAKRAGSGAGLGADLGQGQGIKQEVRSKKYKENPFADFWEIYPRKIDKGHAITAYAAALKKASAEVILAGLTAQLPSLMAQVKPEGNFIPHASTWLNGERWTDDISGNGGPPSHKPFQAPTPDEIAELERLADWKE